MDCRQVKQLLPLWVGQDLPDATSAADVAQHLEKCRDCERQRIGLQNSLDHLQASVVEPTSNSLVHRSVWPELSARISNWRQTCPRERFNGWIPAAVMSLAVALMVAVSIPSLQREFFGGDGNASLVDLFDSEPVDGMPAMQRSNQSPYVLPAALPPRRAKPSTER